MTSILWLVLFALVAAFGWLIRHNMRKWQARRRAEEERFANFMAGTTGAPAPSSAPLPTLPATAPSTATGDELAQQKLLFDAAHKAAEAGEPVLAIQLYARLLARYPATTLASPARTAVEAQKKKLLKA
ncbi:MAG: hypothetical protein AABM33_16305 [Pseudomonadota bacterium]